MSVDPEMARNRLENVTFYIHYRARQRVHPVSWLFIQSLYFVRYNSELELHSVLKLATVSDIDTKYSFDVSKLLTRISSINLYRKFLCLRLSS